MRLWAPTVFFPSSVDGLEIELCQHATVTAFHIDLIKVDGFEMNLKSQLLTEINYLWNAFTVNYATAIPP
jgi:hypothetical protein